MLKKGSIAAALFLLLSMIIFMISMGLNRSYFETLALDSVIWYELRQLLALLLMFAYGLFFLLLLRQTASLRFCILMALPTGIALWCISSLFLLLVGIPYSAFLAGLMQALILGISVLLRRLRAARSGDLEKSSSIAEFLCLSQWSKALPSFLILMGAIFLCSSGLIYVFVSYDSYFYFTIYGNTLTILQNLRDIVGDNSYTLTNISQFLPLLNSYTAFWGLDQCFQFQAVLSLNLLLCFYYAMAKVWDKKALWALLFTVTLAFSTSFLVASTWILANMYCMLYLFLAYLLVHRTPNRENALPGAEEQVMLSLFLTALTLLRKDGIIFVCLFLFYMLLKLKAKKESRKMFLFIFLPSILFEVWWLFTVRVVLKATVQRAAFTSIANNANIAFVAAAIIGTCLYIFLLHPFLQRKLPFSESLLFYAGVLLMLLVLTLRDWNQVVDNVDMTLRNMFLFPSSWGISGFTLGMLLMFALLTPAKNFWDAETFLWLGYLLVNFVSYCAVGKNLWVNWDDSYNRIVLQILPVFVFICGKKIRLLLPPDTPDHSSESSKVCGQ